MVDPASHPIPRVGWYSRDCPTQRLPGPPTGLSPPPVGRSSAVRLHTDVSANAGDRTPDTPFYPGPAARPRSYADPVWAPPVSLAATPGILSLPRGTEMFQFPRSPHGHTAVSPRCRGGVAPFGYPWITRCQHVPRAFRGVAASFIGTQRLGIHRALIIVDSLATTGREHPAPRREAGPRLRHTSSCPGLPRVCCPQWSRGDSNPGPPPCKGGALPAKLRPPLAPGAPGGRAWTRTRDLGLIRTALSPPELRARRPSAPKTECSPNLPIRSIPRIGPARVRPWVTPSPPSTPRCPPRLTTDRLTTPGHP